MDRKLLKRPFTLKIQPVWDCPTCEKGSLRIRENEFKYEETKDSRNYSEIAFEPNWIRYIYVCMLECDNPICKEIVANSGIGSVGELYTDREDDTGGPLADYFNYFEPTHFEPHLKLLKIPPDCPQSVLKPLNESFRVFFASPSAAANCVRIAVEGLLNELKIRKYAVKSGKRRPIPLHLRISKLPPKYSSLTDILFAIKWLGNAGSHSSDEISVDDVLDSYEFMEHVLHEVYAPKAKKLASMARRVNKKKGPVSRGKT